MIRVTEEKEIAFGKGFMHEALEAFSGLLLVMIFLGTFVSGICFWIGGKSLKLKTWKLRKILFCAVFACVITYITTFVLSALPFLGAVTAFFLGLILSLFPIKSFFRISLRQAAGLWVMYAVAQIVAVVLSAELFIGGIAYLLEII